MFKYALILIIFVFPFLLLSQSSIIIDGNFDDWAILPVLVADSTNDEHDTDWFSDGLTEPVPRKYSDVDLLEVKFTHDRDNLYGYVKALGTVGRTSRAAEGQRDGRYYLIITIDVDNNDTTGYPLQEGNYWPNSTGYDMNMEAEFYDGSLNTGHYINHDFLSLIELTRGRIDLEQRIIRLRPGSYKHYLQWVTFPDTSIVYVEDRGPVIEGGIIEVAVSADGHEAEMKAPMWGFFWDEWGEPIIQLGDTIDISFSLEGSGELSESAIELGYEGNKSVWGSDTAEPIVGYYLEDLWTNVSDNENAAPEFCRLMANFPNPFNNQTTIQYSILQRGTVQLFILNIQGQLVGKLVDEIQTAALHQVKWQGIDQRGEPLASGIYYAVLQTGTQRKISPMVLLK